MTPTREQIYLAALLHDIGKFYQRADENSLKKSHNINEDVRQNLEQVLCPSHPVYGFSHKHVLWTAQFFNDFKEHFNQLLQTEKTITADNLMRLSAAHHNPFKDNIYELIIQKADHYSSGADRSKLDEAWQDSELEKSWDKFKKVRMRSIFEGVSGESYQYELPLEKISLAQSFFPSKTAEDKPDYAGLWQEFINETKFIQTHSFKSFSETLLNILEKYTSRIPSSTMHLRDVSLYDHLKTTAAFAVSLYDYIESKGADQLPAKDEKPFLLIGADISGIQKFIYEIIPRGAAKNLKGRSFYLHLLADNIIKLIQDELGLFNANILYASGGGFYIVAPNTTKVKEGITVLEKKIATLLFKTHKTALSISISSVEFGEAELFSNTIGELWFQLSEQLSVKKKQQFKHQLVSEYDSLFSDTGEKGSNREKDAITGEELEATYELLDTYKVNPYTYQQIELGKKLKNADYWILSEEKLNYFSSSPFNPANINYYNYFVSEAYIKQKEEELKGSADKVRAYRINELNFLETAQKGINNVYGFTYYGGNDFPTDPWNGPKTFEELAGIEFETDEKNKRKFTPGLSRLGILRMDVDRLGSVFRNAFDPQRRSFSRYSSLSRSLDYFFKGYLNVIWRENEDYKNFTQIIYSGGDDLFITGKWDIVLKMAKEINEQFRNWTCHTASFTLSGGISVVPPRYPLLNAALLAESAEKKAKQHKYGDVEKNAFHLFGFSLNWDDEYSYVLRLKDSIKNLLQTGLPAGFPSSIFNLMEQADFDKKTNQIRNYQVIWLIAYNFKRAQKNLKNDDVKGFFKEWTDKIFIGSMNELKETKHHPLQLLALASRWASLELRSDKLNNN